MMKRIFLSLAVIMTSLAVNAQQYYGRVNDPDGYVNIRRGASINSAIVRRYNSGDYLYYTPLSNGWSEVYTGQNSNTFMGYMSTSRIVRVNPNSSKPAAPKFYSGYITDPKDNYVNVRRGPGTNYAISSRLNLGKFVYYQPAGNGWAKVYDSNKNFLGYVASSRIRVK